MSDLHCSTTMRTKLVVRRLPPSLPEDVFWAATAQWVTDDTCSFKRYVAGRPEADPPVHSRAYIVMEPERIQAFHSAFDGHVFKPKTGELHSMIALM
jgi:regulator of nonsense transcripts 3